MSVPSTDLARRIIELSSLAPSVHNTQPWLWRIVSADLIELHADRDRQLAASDPDGRNLVISCGAAIHYCTVAAGCLGLATEVSLMPSPTQNDLLATIRFSASRTPADALDTLSMLQQRRTDRRRFTSWPVPHARLDHLAEAAAGFGAVAVPIVDVSQRFRAEQLVNNARYIQLHDPSCTEEQQDWIDHTPYDGVPVSNASPTQHAVRSLPRPNRFAVATSEPDADLVETDGLLAICTAFDDQQAWLQAGQALSALWLRATSDGLSVVPLSQVIEVPETRGALHREVFADMARPQILVRIGWQEITRSDLAVPPRRPTNEVILP